MTERNDCEDDFQDGIVERVHNHIVGESKGPDESTESSDEDVIPPADVTVGTDGATNVVSEVAPDRRSADGGVAPDPEQAAAGDSSAGDATLAGELAAELRAGEVDEATAETLRTQLGGELETAPAVRIDRLAARVDELEAYTDALEEILNRIGTDDDIAAAIEDLDARLQRQEQMGEGYGRLRSGIEDLSDDVETLRDDVETLRRWRESLTSVFADPETEPSGTEGNEP